MNSIEFRLSEYEFQRPQPVVQPPKDLTPGSEAEALYQRSVQPWSALDLSFRFVNRPAL
ncbi:uncharacterized protein LACBIDRAFT_316765 [Laccaria bicolor S238N-H82]|uniref:Predicted protein n=1 Tax=Laccaria bicolor (strain S238N-H82 / ATCC MYA-4686) TaxID=486041 RepID=B0E1K6_LACBS|nr:uncharacterized protein LACBIDRAFT_316765 [Laccaria bicolor S238N-H82]EDQ99257.1 predicted protein [Laccaria bicolor S238N-H82]|eukprot:XP_001890067.1 predicted protein [Laccaria bicolor S238N-H82]